MSSIRYRHSARQYLLNELLKIKGLNQLNLKFNGHYINGHTIVPLSINTTSTSLQNLTIEKDFFILSKKNALDDFFPNLNYVNLKIDSKNFILASNRNLAVYSYGDWNCEGINLLFPNSKIVHQKE